MTKATWHDLGSDLQLTLCGKYDMMNKAEFCEKCDVRMEAKERRQKQYDRNREDLRADSAGTNQRYFSK